MIKEKWNALTEDQKEEVRRYKREWYSSNRASLSDDELVANREDSRLRMQKHRAGLPPEKLKELAKKSRDWKAANPIKQNASWRAWWLRTNYGITIEEYLAKVAEQNGCCAICKEPTDKLVVDHCHEGNFVRGLLCSPCNTGLGHFKDNTDRLQRAVEYLGEHQPSTGEG